MRKWSLRILSLLLVFSFTALANAQPKKSGPEVDRLFSLAQSSGTVRVIVELDPDNLMTATTQGAASLNKKQRIQRAADGMLERMNAAGKRGIKRFKHLPFVALETTPEGLQEILASPESAAVHEDRLHAPSLVSSVPQIGAEQAHNSGFTGEGHSVAILDTGVERTHTFLLPMVVSEACYSTTSLIGGSTSVCPNGQNSQVGTGAARPCDVRGCEHGTHVAGIAAGDGATFNGVARDADIIAVQVFSRFDSSGDCGGAPPCALAWTSDITSGLERVYELRNSFNIAAVNLSLGGGRYFSACDNDPVKPAIDLLRSADIATVIASGNNGWSDAVSSPACISTAVTVGSTTKGDDVSGFSNSSALVDLLAPGSLILSSVTSNNFGILSGTSMATPHVVGAYAVLRSASPTATVDEILAALASTGVPILDSRNNLTLPRIQVDQAIAALGAWPSTDLEVTPAGYLASSGTQGGPFSPASLDYTVTNGGSGAMDFTVANAADWVTITPDSGTLGGGQSTTVTVAIGPAANQLAPGVYHDTVRFTDTSGTSGSEERPVDLLVTGPEIDNDKFDDATALSAASGSTQGSNQGATKEAGEPDHGDDPGGASVWWQWVAPSAGTLTVNTFGSDFDTTLGLYLGNSVSALTSLAQNNDAGGTAQSEATIDVVAGTTYHFAVDGFAGQGSAATGNITLRWIFEGDNVGIGDLSVTPEDGFSATGDVGGPFSPTSKTYTLTNTSAGPLDYTVVTEGNFFDADKTGGQLPKGGTDTVTLTLNANADLLPPGTSNGNLFLNGINRPVTVTAIPVGGLNDDFADAALVTGVVPVSLQTTNEGATKETGEPDHAGNAGGASLWWSWTVPATGIAVIDTFGSNFDTLLAVYTGTALNDLTEVASNDDSSPQSRVSFDATAGEQFWIAVDGFNAAAGSVTLNLDIGDAVQGDAFADALPITDTLQTSSTVTASKEAGEPDHAGDAGGHSVWWVWTATANETVTIDTFGSSFNTLLAVYTGQAVNALTEVASNDDADVSSGIVSSKLSFDAVAGTSYYIAVDGFAGASGDVMLTFQGGGFVADLFASTLPASRSVVSGTLASVFASMVNGSGATATGCRIEVLNTLPGTFNYRTTDPLTNQPDPGPPNPVVDIPVGGSQSYVFELTPTEPFGLVDIQFSYACDNAGPATVASGLNTVLLSSSDSPTADIVALATTTTGQGTVLAAPGAPGAFAVATVNVGSGEVITVAPSASDPALPVTLTVCETNPMDGICLAQPGNSVTRSIASNVTPTFSIFVDTTASIPFLPADNRIRVVFTDPAGNVKGATSVAVASSLP